MPKFSKLKKFANENQLELTILACGAATITGMLIARKVLNDAVIVRNDFISEQNLDGEFLLYLIQQATSK